jgi:predicted ATPase
VLPPSFCTHCNNASAIAQVCRRLDGIAPRSISASRVKVLRVEQIAEVDDASLAIGGAFSRAYKSRALID